MYEPRRSGGLPTAVRFRTDFDAFDWAFLLLALVLAGIHLYLGLVAGFVPEDRASQFVLVALALLVGPRETNRRAET